MINIYPFINDIWGLNTVTTAKRSTLGKLLATLVTSVY